MSGMRIAFFGSSLVSAYWNGAATYYRGIIRALAARGHEVTFYEPDVYDRQKNRDIADPSWAKVVVYGATEDDLMRALDEARAADLVVKTSGVGVFDELLEEAVLETKTRDSIMAFWDVDAAATLERVSANLVDYFRALIPRYDLIFTYGGGERVVNRYLSFGARACVPIYNALDPETHYPVSSDSRFCCDLALLANRLPDRESRIEEFFLRAAATAPELTFLLGGNGWEDKEVPANVRRVGHVFTRDHNAVNCSARAVLNVNRQSMASYGFSPPTRIFEAAGAGACVISDYWEGIEQFLEPEKEALLAKSGAEVAAHLRALTPEHARNIGAAARKRMLAQHTYEHRADELEQVLGVYCEKRNGEKLNPHVNALR